MIEIRQPGSENEEIGSYEEFVEKGHSFVWCLVANITEEHEFGEEHEIKVGTKQFRPGAKVYLAPVQWGDGFENVVAIGVPRHSKRYIEIITRREYMENFRVQKVFKPAILKLMCSSEYRWRDDSDEAKADAEDYLTQFNLQKCD